ncbi:MAG: cyclic pyranopterin monophosphate synthase MoaC [Bacteroidales bacterium]|jgi:cyclic pyranopterin phosphate synthase|nr:cyclic pyranopterin monophosphate synthase MoaC [Bacteroidales bacterium]MDD3989252.1 cyclic pyranopterin monophosphate synthase MoaC [Bacteroidales bacterium]
MKLSHTNGSGDVNMVDVGGKEITLRIARATGHITLKGETLQLIKDNLVKKGSVITAAEIAGIMAAKRCHELIPLCHPLMLTKIDVKIAPDALGLTAESMVSCIGRTGVEMEALTAVTVALLTVYDMCKAVDKEMEIEGIKLISKIKSPL